MILDSTTTPVRRTVTLLYEYKLVFSNSSIRPVRNNGALFVAEYVEASVGSIAT